MEGVALGCEERSDERPGGHRRGTPAARIQRFRRRRRGGGSSSGCRRSSPRKRRSTSTSVGSGIWNSLLRKKEVEIATAWPRCCGRSNWQTRNQVSYAEKYAHLEAPLTAITEAHPELRVPEGRGGTPGYASRWRTDRCSSTPTPSRGNSGPSSGSDSGTTIGCVVTPPSETGCLWHGSESSF